MTGSGIRLYVEDKFWFFFILVSPRFTSIGLCCENDTFPVFLKSKLFVSIYDCTFYHKHSPTGSLEF